MTLDESWQSALENSASAGFHVQSLDAALTEADWASLADENLPETVRAFAELWARHELDSWRVLVESAATVNPDIGEQVSDGVALAPLRSLLVRAERAALVFGHPSHWTSPDQWGYLLHVRHAQRDDVYENVILHPPAKVSDLAQVEHVLAMRLPLSFRRFLLLTNGLGIGEREFSYVCGAGPRRANWHAVLLNLWMECGGQHEVAAQWREFQGTYAYERIMDRERGENTFLSDETALIPFAHTNDDWCFDRTRRDSAGEFPIVFWDHEMREAADRYTDFDGWFAGEVKSYLFGE